MGGLPLIPPTRWELGQLADDTGFPPTQLEKAVRLLALVEPTSSTCRCSLEGWRCEHIKAKQLEVDPPDRGHGLSL